MSETADAAYDVVVVGAGPGGFAGAVAAADAGLAVAVLDAGSAPGGQFWRQPAAALRARRPGALHHGWRTYAAWRGRFDAHVASGAVAYFAEHHVWAAERIAEGGFAVHALAGVARSSGRTVTAATLLLATGAYERQLPFPGWTLPGVVTAGGAQAQLKDSLVVPGRRVVVAGTGPLLLTVAASLVSAGAEVPAVVEAADPLRYARHPGALVRNPGKLVEGAGYAATLARYRVPVHTRHAVVEAHGDRWVEAVTVAKTDRAGRLLPGRSRTIACDALAVGYGLDAQLELAVELGCETRREPDGGWVLAVDDEQRTSVAGVWAAGESTGIGGAQLALIEGELAGASLAAAHRRRTVRGAGRQSPAAALAAGGHAGRGMPGVAAEGRASPATAATARARGTSVAPSLLLRRRSRLRAFAAALQDVHPVPGGWTDRLRDDTEVCRCEEVPLGAIRDAVTELGATEPRSAKLLTRAGMGWCQGRMCGTAVPCVVAELTGGAAPSAASPPSRPLACPVPLGILAGTGDGPAPRPT